MVFLGILVGPAARMLARFSQRSIESCQPGCLKFPIGYYLTRTIHPIGRHVAASFGTARQSILKSGFE
jgi:hypothetical protein